MIDYILRES